MTYEKTLVDELMDIAMEQLKVILPENQEADDWAWGSDCFRFGVFEYSIGPDGRPIEKCCGYYSFYYHEDEELWGQAEDQVKEWLEYEFGQRY